MFPILMGGSAATGAAERELSVCGFVREPLAFWLFRRAAGVADVRRLDGIRDVEPVSFQTADDRLLRGYRLRAAAPLGYLLVAQGNAMLADQLVGELAFFRERGLDVYVYDYRGYGRSEGKSRLHALIQDYRELAAALNAREYRRRLLYGLSLGGVVLLNALGASGDHHALVIDSAPSRISPLGCPERYDPVNHLPADSSRIRILAGGRDRVVRPAEMTELVRAARQRGARVLEVPEFAHPFQDESDALHRRRLQAVADLLLR